MRSAALALVVLSLGTAGAAAQPLSIEKLFLDASAKEQAVRTALASPVVTETALKAVRTVVADFETIVRRFPTSAYCDDALWRAGQLSLEAFAKFGDAQDKTAGIRLLRAVASQYPTSKFAKQVPAVIASVEKLPEPSAKPAAAMSRAPAVAPPPPPPVPVKTTGTSRTAATRVVTIRAIRRLVLPDSIRIVIELDGELPAFHDERLANPVRVFVDLPSTQPAPELVDRTIRFDTDGDVVRQVRLGRHPNTTTRVVVDASGISSYSVYPLYGPYRLVIDFVKDAPPVPSLQGRRIAAIAIASLPNVPTTRLVLPRETPDRPLQGRRVPVPAAAALPRVTTPRPLPRETALPPLASTPVKTRPVGAVTAPPGQPLTSALEGMLAAATTPATAASTAAATTAPIAATTTTTAPVTAPPPNSGGGLSIARQLGLGVSRIVIDPGHGGHDPGGVVRGTTEAQIVLDVALRLETLLEKVPGVEVILTRRTDDFLPLQERTAIANREGADLFLSIHANANANTRASGVETYFLNFATNSSAAAIAARENATSGQTMGALPDFVKAIALNNKMDESRDFATLVQRSMVSTLAPNNKGLRDLGVKQAPFVVLIGASMPSVLAEISFLTNVQEARLLRTQAYRQKIAEALYEAIRKYQSTLKSETKVATQQ